MLLAWDPLSVNDFFSRESVNEIEEQGGGETAAWPSELAPAVFLLLLLHSLHYVINVVYCYRSAYLPCLINCIFHSTISSRPEKENKLSLSVGALKRSCNTGDRWYGPVSKPN
jgi:hypothetical protein